MLSQIIYPRKLGLPFFFDITYLYQLFSCALSCHVVYGCKLNIWLSRACLMLPPSILCIIELCFVPPSSPEFQREHSYSWGTLTVSMVQQHTPKQISFQEFGTCSNSSDASWRITQIFCNLDYGNIGNGVSSFCLKIIRFQENLIVFEIK